MVESLKRFVWSKYFIVAQTNDHNAMVPKVETWLILFTIIYPSIYVQFKSAYTSVPNTEGQFSFSEKRLFLSLQHKQTAVIN